MLSIYKFKTYIVTKHILLLSASHFYIIQKSVMVCASIVGTHWFTNHYPERLIWFTNHYTERLIHFLRKDSKIQKVLATDSGILLPLEKAPWLSCQHSHFFPFGTVTTGQATPIASARETAAMHNQGDSKTHPLKSNSR